MAAAVATATSVASCPGLGPCVRSLSSLTGPLQGGGCARVTDGDPGPGSPAVPTQLGPELSSEAASTPTRVREAASAPTRARGAASIPTRVRATLVRRSGRALPACGVRAAWAGAASVGAAAGKTPRAKAGGPTGRAGPGSGGEARVRVVPLPWALEARGAGALAIRRPTRSKTSRDRGEDVGQASGERDSSVHSPGAGVRISKRLRTWPWRQR